ncbi:hypothetical protein OM076_39020 [Solirubrobacter ginsenosidimutans]|uniref:Uncharacterized protein n=1 Tax=Solirubrobacter ginsenosidimutans TaxID=490573 RepID=A0A9X3N3C7_9ACTN|nr:hypothetical protein [Solirubrobacter ginsenosidimutans]MDA0166323.1 hypothetical protein [Solirubrobacter ginsenosidimutans]
MKACGSGDSKGNMNRISAFIVVVAVALVAAGCGGSDTDEFNDGVKKAQQPMDQAAKNADNADPGQMDRYAQAMDDTVARLRELDAPDEAQDEYDAFIKEIEAGADAARDTSSAARSGDKEAFAEAIAQLEQHFKAISEKAEAVGTAVG